MDACCKTRYPILLLHGAGFRDLKRPFYWGRIPDALEAHGAALYYGRQVILAILSPIPRPEANTLASRPPLEWAMIFTFSAPVSSKILSSRPFRNWALSPTLAQQSTGCWKRPGPYSAWPP